MKIGFFNDWRLGVITLGGSGGDGVVDVMDAVRQVKHMGPHDLINGVIEQFATLRKPIEEAAAKGKGVPLASVKMRAPLPRPVTIDCMAVNYMEDGTLKEAPAINAFHKSPSAIIGPGETMVLPDVPARVFEGEAEMALIIGKRASNVKAADAMPYIFGYTNFIDGSARGLPPANNVFFQMKSRETFAPIGPWITTADEVRNPQELKIQLWNNGVLKQNFNTNDMAHKIPRCIEWATHCHTLLPGDIIATGTNHRGLHAFHDGDHVELEVEGLGRLHFDVRDELKRTWTRDSRLERTQKGLDPLNDQLTGKHAPVKK